MMMSGTTSDAELERRFRGKRRKQTRSKIGTTFVFREIAPETPFVQLDCSINDPIAPSTRDHSHPSRIHQPLFTIRKSTARGSPPRSTKPAQRRRHDSNKQAQRRCQDSKSSPSKCSTKSSPIYPMTKSSPRGSALPASPQASSRLYRRAYTAPSLWRM